MTEEEFIEGFKTWRDIKQRTSETWRDWMVQPEQRVYYEELIDHKIRTVEQARELWQRENSPLVKALK